MATQIVRRLVPHYFAKEPIGEIVNPDMLKAIEQVKACPNATAAAQLALELLAAKFNSKRFETYALFHKAFGRDPNKLWNRHGFMHCTHQNFLLRVLLVESRQVADSDIELGYSYVWHFSPHQFLKVKLGGTWVALDPWNYGRGVKMGYYATGFGVKTLKRSRVE